MKLDANLIPYSKMKSKWIIGIHLRAKTIKLLKENIGVLCMTLALARVGT